MGAVSRFLLSTWVQRLSHRGFPLGTLSVNLLGCFAIGILMSVVQSRDFLTPNARLLIGAGFLGSLTTFSTFGFETLELSRDGDLRLATFNVVTNLAGGLLAVSLGHWLSRLVGIGV